MLMRKAGGLLLGVERSLFRQSAAFLSLQHSRKGTRVIVESEEYPSRLDFQFIPHKIQRSIYKKHRENPEYWTVSRIAKVFVCSLVFLTLPVLLARRPSR